MPVKEKLKSAVVGETAKKKDDDKKEDAKKADDKK